MGFVLVGIMLVMMDSVIVDSQLVCFDKTRVVYWVSFGCHGWGVVSIDG